MNAANELELTLAVAYTHGTSTYLEVAEDLSALLASGEIHETGVVRVFDDEEWVLLYYGTVDTVNDRLTDLAPAAPRNASAGADAHEFAIGSKVWGSAAADYVNERALSPHGNEEHDPAMQVEGADVELEDGKVVKLQASFPEDHTYTGLVREATAGEILAFGDLCYVKSDGKLWKAKADAAATMPATAVALEALAADATGKFMIYWGFIRDDSWTFTVGAPVYVSAATAGALTQTIPNAAGQIAQVIGIPRAANELTFRPDVVPLGEIATVAYRGDRGKAAYDHSQAATGAEHGAVAAATANMIARRDAAARLAVADGSAAGDAANKGQLDAHAGATTGIHGVGAGTVAKTSDIPHAVASATHTDWPAGLTATELGYVDGVTSAIQGQLDAKANIETTSRTIYVNADTGNDTTGDGSSGAPYLTFAKAISTVKTAIADAVTITIILKAATATYTITSFGRLCVGSGNIVIEGELSTTVSGTATGGSATTIADTTKSWGTNAYAGKLVKFTKSGTDYWRLIESNTATVLTVIGRLEVTPASGDAYVIHDWATLLANSAAVLSQGTVTLRYLACSILSGLVLFSVTGSTIATFDRVWIKAVGAGAQGISITGAGNHVRLTQCFLDANTYNMFGIAGSTAMAAYVLVQRSWIKASSASWAALLVGGSGGFVVVNNGTIVESGTHALLLDRNANATTYSSTINGAVDKITIRNGVTYGLRITGNAGCNFTGTDYVVYSGNGTDRSADVASYCWYTDL